MFLETGPNKNLLHTCHDSNQEECQKSSSKNILPIEAPRLTDWDGLALFAGFSECHRIHLALLSSHCKSSPIFHNLIASSGISTKIIVVIIVKSSPWSLILNPSLFSYFDYYYYCQDQGQSNFSSNFLLVPVEFQSDSVKNKEIFTF